MADNLVLPQLIKKCTIDVADNVRPCCFGRARPSPSMRRLFCEVDRGEIRPDLNPVGQSVASPQGTFWIRASISLRDVVS